MADKKVFEDKITEIEEIINKLNSNETSLDDSILLYSKAAALITDCNQTLNDAKLQIDEITIKLEKIDEN